MKLFPLTERFDEASEVLAGPLCWKGILYGDWEQWIYGGLQQPMTDVLVLKYRKVAWVDWWEMDWEARRKLTSGCQILDRGNVHASRGIAGIMRSFKLIPRQANMAFLLLSVDLILWAGSVSRFLLLVSRFRQQISLVSCQAPLCYWRGV